jgi:glycerate dehydrogenase
MKELKIVMLDRDTIGMDIDVSMFREFGIFEEYQTMSVEDTKEKIEDADVLIFNKTKMNEELLKDAKKVKLLCVTATGYDNIDLDYTKSRGIVSTNVKGYSTASVVQHTFALALYLIEKLPFYDSYVKSGEYAGQKAFAHFGQTFHELAGKTWGIIGLGNIGKAVAKIADAFGCKVIYHSVSGSKQDVSFEAVNFDKLLKESDIISLHCPLTDLSRNLFNKEAFEKMKETAILINVARGPIVNEQDLYEALDNNQIAAAGLDVLKKEPMHLDNSLLKIQDSKKLLITPHMAWASVEARTRCIQEIHQNITAFIKGIERNVL